MTNPTIVALCPICKVTRNCAPDGCLKCHLSGRVAAGATCKRCGEEIIDTHACRLTTGQIVSGVPAGELEAAIKAGTVPTPAAHDCEAESVPYASDGALGHGWECGICGTFLQAG